MLKDIFEESFQHQYYIELARAEVEQQIREEVRAQAFEEGLEEGREEERQAYLQAQRKFLPMIVQSRFPELTRLAKTQARQINDVTVMNEILVNVCTTQNIEETINALISWLPDNDPEEETMPE